MGRTADAGTSERSRTTGSASPTGAAGPSGTVVAAHAQDRHGRGRRAASASGCRGTCSPASEGGARRAARGDRGAGDGSAGAARAARLDLRLRRRQAARRGLPFRAAADHHGRGLRRGRRRGRDRGHAAARDRPRAGRAPAPPRRGLAGQGARDRLLGAALPRGRASASTALIARCANGCFAVGRHRRRRGMRCRRCGGAVIYAAGRASAEARRQALARRRASRSSASRPSMPPRATTSSNSER